MVRFHQLRWAHTPAMHRRPVRPPPLRVTRRSPDVFISGPRLRSCWKGHWDAESDRKGQGRRRPQDLVLVRSLVRRAGLSVSHARRPHGCLAVVYLVTLRPGRWAWGPHAPCACHAAPTCYDSCGVLYMPRPAYQSARRHRYCLQYCTVRADAARDLRCTTRNDKVQCTL
jgi:hypothetical protein